MSSYDFLDQPAEEDLLNHSKLYRGLTELITKAKRPFVLAVVGPWGSGKTTLISKTLEALKDSYQIAEFNAWSNSKGMPLLKALFVNLAAKEEGAWKRGKEKFKDLAKSPVASAAVRGFGSLGGPIGAAIAEGLLQCLPKNAKSEGDEADNVKLLVKEFTEVAEIFEEKDKPLLIFIDDLDRCSPTEALDLIDDIKVYLTVEAPVVFIVAIDRRTLSMGIHAKYGAESEISVDDYLQKIFSYVFHMPKSTQLDTLIVSAVSGIGVREKELDLVTIAKAVISKFEFESIRSIKRIVRRWAFLVPSNINDYLRSAGLKDYGRYSDPEKLAQFLLLLCALFELYPEYFEALVDFKSILRFQHDADEATIKSSLESIMKEFYQFYLTSHGRESNDTDVIRLREGNRLLDSIVSAIAQSSFLKEDNRFLMRSYYKCIPRIISAVRLGLPLVS